MRRPSPVSFEASNSARIGDRLAPSRDFAKSSCWPLDEAARKASAAAAAFQQIVNHSGLVWNCWTGALAQLGLARANALEARNASNDAAKAARTRALSDYRTFLALWKNADGDIPILNAAEVEYANLISQ